MKYANRKQNNSATVSGDFLLTLTDSMKLGPALSLTSPYPTSRLIKPRLAHLKDIFISVSSAIVLSSMPGVPGGGGRELFVDFGGVFRTESVAAMCKIHPLGVAFISPT